MRRVSLAVVVLTLLGCGQPNSEQLPPSASDTAADGPQANTSGPAGETRPRLDDPLLLQRWSRSCALCHVNGEGGAPQVGHAAEWQPRLARGNDILLAHTLEGYNNMPPLGYCMGCSREEFAKLIAFMSESP